MPKAQKYFSTVMAAPARMSSSATQQIFHVPSTFHVHQALYGKAPLRRKNLAKHLLAMLPLTILSHPIPFPRLSCYPNQQEYIETMTAEAEKRQKASSSPPSPYSFFSRIKMKPRAPSSTACEKENATAGNRGAPRKKNYWRPPAQLRTHPMDENS